MKIRIVLLAIAAAAGVLLGTTHLGNNPLLPGAELGIAISVTPAGDTIVITHDSADMDAFVELAVAPAGGDGFSALLDNGTVLGVTVQPRVGGWFLRVHKAGGPSSEKFMWPNGVPIRISRHVSSPTAAVRAIDWQVFAKDNESDAAWKARRRLTWRWISLVLLLLSAAGAVLTSIPDTKEPAKKAHSARDSVEALIDEVTGKDKEETGALRAYLRKRYIQSASLQESLDATGLSPARARAIVVKARNIFPARVLNLIGDLQDVYAALMKPDVEPPKDDHGPEPAKHD
jgi:hypothetical protein